MGGFSHPRYTSHRDYCGDQIYFPMTWSFYFHSVVIGAQAVAERKELHSLALALERAENEERRGFPEQESLPMLAQQRQGTAAALEAERVDILRLAQVKKNEGQLYVPDVHRYTRGKYTTMVAFTRDCEHTFAVRLFTYASARSQVMFGIRHLTGETQNN